MFDNLQNMKCTMLLDANKTIRKLKDEGDTIHFVTARLINIKNRDTEKITNN